MGTHASTWFGRHALLAALMLAGCAPVGPAPATEPPATTASPTASADTTPPPLEGPTRLAVSATVKSACVPPPQGCRYWILLLNPGGATYRAELRPDTLGPGPLQLLDGLPTSLPGGRYALVFEVGVVSDVPSFAPDGSMLDNTWHTTGCTALLDVQGEDRDTIRVAFNGFECVVRTIPASL